MPEFWWVPGTRGARANLSPAYRAALTRGQKKDVCRRQLLMAPMWSRIKVLGQPSR